MSASVRLSASISPRASTTRHGRHGGQAGKNSRNRFLPRKEHAARPFRQKTANANVRANRNSNLSASRIRPVAPESSAKLRGARQRIANPYAPVRPQAAFHRSNTTCFPLRAIGDGRFSVRHRTSWLRTKPRESTIGAPRRANRRPPKTTNRAIASSLRKRALSHPTTR